MKELLTALHKSKSNIGAISKDSKNPFFKSMYFDVNKLIEHVEPILIENDLVLLQPITDGKVVTQIHHVHTGQMIQSEMNLPNIQDAQKMGSAITYFRRYTLQSLLALQAEDDDGNKAVKPAPKAKKQEKPELIPSDREVFMGCVSALVSGKYTIVDIEKKYKLTESVKDQLVNEASKHVDND
jgi:hypothetical protein